MLIRENEKKKARKGRRKNHKHNAGKKKKS
jgi:hypothetical protein